MTDDTSAQALISTAQLCERAGVTQRQADYWTNEGQLHATVAARGSGTQRKYDEREVRVARYLGFVSPMRSGMTSDVGLLIRHRLERIAVDVRRGVLGAVIVMPGLILDLDLICGEPIADDEALAV